LLVHWWFTCGSLVVHGWFAVDSILICSYLTHINIAAGLQVFCCLLCLVFAFGLLPCRVVARCWFAAGSLLYPRVSFMIHCLCIVRLPLVRCWFACCL
jgi:hypothetical protein